MRRFTTIFMIGLALFLFQTAIQAQTTGSLSGTVNDPKGDVIPGASVTIKNPETGEVRTATTNDKGVFTFGQVPPGNYTVTVENAGFKKAVASNVKVDLSSDANITIALEIGGLGETVTVTSGQDVINTSSPTLTNVINTRQVTDLPLGGRNPVELAGLQAGIAVVGENVRGASVAGLRQTAVTLTQDGINAMDMFVKTSSFFAITTPSLNSTAEFSITTGTVGSDSGRGAAQVNMVTRGGTNDYHGGGFFQVINNWTDSNTWFNNWNAQPKPILRQHFYGFDIGGPMHFLNFGEGVPKHWSGKDKAFFFFSYEKFSQSDARARNRTVMTPSARAGNFTYDGTIPTTGVPANCTGLTATTMRCTTNLLTLSSRGLGLNPLMTTHLNQIPGPNNTSCGGDGFNISCFSFNAAQSTINDKYVFRYDHQLVKDTWAGSHKLEFVYSKVITRTYPDVTTNGIDAPFPGGVNGFQASERNLWTPALVSTFGSNWTNVFRYGRQWAPVDFNRDSLPQSVLVLSGVTGYDQQFVPQPRNTIVNQYTDTLSWVNGNHLWKFGADFQQVLGISRNDAGIYQFITLGRNASNEVGFVQSSLPGASATTFDNARAVWANITGNLAGSTRTFNVESPTSGFVPGATRLREVRGRDLALFGMDQWRMRSNFTFSYGLRWEFMGVPTVPNGLSIQPAFKDMYGVSGFGNLFKPTAAPGSQTAGVATQQFVSGDTGIGLYKNDWNNFAPFVGFAWSPSFKSGPLHFLFGDEGKSSIRAGYSMSYLREGVTTFTNLLGVGNTNPGLIQNSINSPLSQVLPTDPITNLIRGVLGPGGVPLVTPVYRMPITDRQNFELSPNNGLWTVDPDLRTPYVHQYNFGIEREIAGGMAIELRYQGNFSPNNWRAYNINEVNIFENGFLTEFLNAQRNLTANEAAFAAGDVNRRACPGFVVPGTSVCQSSATNTTLVARVPTFVFFGAGTGTFAMPALSAFFTGFAANSGNGFASATFVTNLTQNNVGTMANTLAFSTTYKANRESVAVGLPANFFVANPNAAFANILTNDSSSNYNAMEIEIRKRFSNGLQFQADYTWSKGFVRGDAQGNNQADLVSHATLRNPRHDYNLSSQDQRWRFIANGIYDLPFGRGRTFLDGSSGVVDRIVGGWSLGLITAWHAGSPFTITAGRTTFNQLTNNNGAQLTGITFEEFKKNVGVYKDERGVFFINPDLLNITLCTPAQVAARACGSGQATAASLKPGLMTAPAPGTFGNFPINELSGPTFFNVDLSVTKRIRITETVRFEIKATAINVLNHPNFVFGSQNFDSNQFGRITGTNNLGRRMNFIGQLRF